MKYGKLFKAYKFFYIMSLFTSNLFVNVKLLSVYGNVPKLIKFFLQKCGAYLSAALKTIVIPLSTVFTRISTAALIPPPKRGAYLSNHCNLQLKSLLQLGQNVITFRTKCHYI